MLEIQNLRMLPNESVQNLVHRISILVRKVHPQVCDKMALESIKMQYFLNAIPSVHKFKILECNLDNLELVVQKAQLLQDLEIQSEVLASSTSQQPTLHELSAQVNSLNAELLKTKTELNQFRENKPRIASNFDKDSVQSFKSNSVKHNFNNRNRINNSYRKGIRKANKFCSFCKKNGHVLDSCYQLQAFIKNRDSNRKYSQKRNSRESVYHDNFDGNNEYNSYHASNSHTQQSWPNHSAQEFVPDQNHSTNQGNLN